MRVHSWLATIIAVSILHQCYGGDGNIGCLFDPNLCIEQVEWCYDDLAFGRCLQDAVEPDELYRYEFLSTEQLEALKVELERLLALGYSWSHSHTQCRLQAMLYFLKQNLDFDMHMCDRFIESFEKKPEIGEPLAYVRFTPSLSDPNAIFADEVYYPPASEYSDLIENDVLQDSLNEPIEDEPIYDPRTVTQIQKKAFGDNFQFIPAMHRRADINAISLNVRALETNDISSDPYEDDVDNEVDSPNSENRVPFYPFQQNPLVPDYKPVPIIKFLNDLQQFKVDDIGNLWDVEPRQVWAKHYRNYDRNGDSYLNDDHDMDEEEMSEFQNRIAQIQADMNAPRNPEESDDNDTPEPRIYYDDLEYFNANDESGSGENTMGRSSLFDNLDNSIQDFERRLAYKKDKLDEEVVRDAAKQEAIDRSRIYTEGGIVLVPDARTKNLDKKGNGNWGFKRHERLDVKKPGPPFDVKIIVEDAKKPSLKTGTMQEDYSVDHKTKKTIPAPTDLEFYKHNHQYDVDDTYAYIDLKESIRTWKEGTHIVNELERIFEVEPGTFTNPKFQRQQITFRVRANEQGLNASTVAAKIDELKETIKEKLGVEVSSSGIGNKTKKQIIWTSEKIEDDQQELFVIRLLLVCLLGAAALSLLTLSLVWQHAVTKRKLHRMTATSGDTEISKDYQELCRSRMATKNTPTTQSQEKTEGVHGRITSLSRESDQQSPSSRSSTSSWSEEPVLSNMDISTGHMVLSYMEDHLKNKDRLEQEWVALCAYEAEPCSTAIAQKPENADKNRNPHVLPYDHSRVILSSLANITGCDYINASTITDHDPRNPAYIATQGPLPHTAQDFWQMVWEQGTVVMVLLTRLTENGVAMCHRYWPEEGTGSELYHIYEVHHVSEHARTDDYLVRSFYLKNIKTGETRTVSQYHFLAWPENGVPTSTKALLEFRRKVNKSYRGRSCPIIVHCSDGAGRTGTYCLIDMVLNRMSKGAKEIDIAATLEHIRDQRPAMVTTKQQFEFVLMAVAEEVHAILKALPATIEKQ